MPSSTITKPRNRILAGLNETELEILLPSFELSQIFIKEPLYEPDKPLKRAYFPESGLMSIVTVMENKTQVEALSVGIEGMVGLPLVLGSTSTSTRAFCQMSGTVWVVDAENLASALKQCPELNKRLLRYAQSAFDILAQTTSCNRIHSTEQRCARWLLLTRDRLGSDTFPLTHEFLASMLGVRRPGLSLVAKNMQNSSLISYKHGNMTITNGAGLEKLSCLCYQVARRQIDLVN
jgi:CRP-like cAMP-binding protein